MVRFCARPAGAAAIENAKTATPCTARKHQPILFPGSPSPSTLASCPGPCQRPDGTGVGREPAPGGLPKPAPALPRWAPGWCVASAPPTTPPWPASSARPVPAAAPASVASAAAATLFRQPLDQQLRRAGQPGPRIGAAEVQDQRAGDQRIQGQHTPAPRRRVTVLGQPPAGIEGPPPGDDTQAAQQRLEARQARQAMDLLRQRIERADRQVPQHMVGQRRRLRHRAAGGGLAAGDAAGGLYPQCRRLFGARQ